MEGGTFAQAARRAASPQEAGGGPPEPPASAPRGPLVADPRSGQVYEDLAVITTDTLAELVTVYRQWVADLEGWRRQVEREIVKRLQDEGHRVAVVGPYEVAYAPRRRREWSADDLAFAAGRLVHDGTIEAADTTELIRREVNGSAALALLNRLAGEAREAIEDCFTWVEGRPTLTVERSVNLADALPDGGR